jgi:preprotein translocase subunit SecE
MNRIVQFFKDSLAELRKVIWPNRDEVIASTKVVVISTLIIACALGLLDLFLLMGINLAF